jgi:hypothetical protein
MRRMKTKVVVVALDVVVVKKNQVVKIVEEWEKLD